MCYHVATPSKKQLQSKFQNKEVWYEGDEIFHVNGFERPFLPVELNTSPGFIQQARWKLLPFCVKNEKAAAQYANTLNADAETIFERSSYKPFIPYYRGLLYVTGFFEPHQVENKKETDNYFIYEANRQIFTIGIVYAEWRDEFTGIQYPTFSIITTKANDFMAQIHNVKKRMPLIIPAALHQDWMQAKNPDTIQQLMQPLADETLLSAHRVIRVTGIRGEDTNTSDIQQPISNEDTNQGNDFQGTLF